MIEKKYEILTHDRKYSYSFGYEDDVKTVYRVRALKDFGDIKKGELGGFIENESNLSHKGKCWVSDNARVFDKAIVKDDAQVFDKASIEGSAIIKGCSCVRGFSTIKDNVIVQDNAYICGHSFIDEHAQIGGNASIRSGIREYMSYVTNNAKVFGNARIVSSCIREHAEISGNSNVSYYNICGCARLMNDALINKFNDYITFPNFSSNGESATFYMTIDNIIYVTCGCFNGTINQFKIYVKKRYNHDRTQRHLYLYIIKVAKEHFLY